MDYAKKTMFATLFVEAMNDKLDIINSKKAEMDAICEDISKMVAPLAALYKQHPDIGSDVANKLDMSHINGFYRRGDVVRSKGYCIIATGYDSFFTVSIHVDTGDFHRAGYDNRYCDDSPYFYVSHDFNGNYTVKFRCDEKLEYRIIPSVLNSWKNIEDEITSWFEKVYMDALDL